MKPFFPPGLYGLYHEACFFSLVLPEWRTIWSKNSGKAEKKAAIHKKEAARGCAFEPKAPYRRDSDDIRHHEIMRLVDNECLDLQDIPYPDKLVLEKVQQGQILILADYELDY